jgi:hypothetical protein
MPSFPVASSLTSSLRVRTVLPGAYSYSRGRLTVRFLPDWFPGAGFKRLARVAKARGEHMVDGAFDAAKKAMIGEDSMVSLVGTLLSREGPEEMTREEYEYTIKWAAGSLYGGT